MGHREHPLLNHEVVDTAHGDRIGILRAVAPDVDLKTTPTYTPYADQRSKRTIDEEPCVAWLAPVEGGVEWPTDIGAIREA